MSIEMTTEFQQALELLNSGRNLFLTGKAGTGKSTLINHYKKNTDRNVVVAAPTGVAALNVGGYTIHRLFSYSPHTTLEEIKSGKARPGRFARVLKKLDTLIIDEASMVRADLFDQLVTSLEMYGPHPGEPYGGVQVVLVGDLYQLPPVVGSYEEGWFFKNYETPFFFSAKTFVRTDFPVVQLSKVFRQIGDSTLVDLLNSIREGRMSTAVSYALNQRTQEQFTPPLDEYWLTLASTNRSVDKRNREALEELPGELFESHAIVEGQEDGFDEPTKRILHLKIGAQVMLLNNDSSRRWVNGSIGTVQKITSGDDGLTVEVLLNNGKTVEVTPHRWEITRPRLVGGNLQHDVIGAFTQLPMKLAWAITIHKSQGQTLERAVIDLKSGTRAPGQLYVALSRCTSLDGLVLTRNIAPRDVKIDHRVHRFLLESREECSADRCFIEGLYVGEEDGFIRPIEIALGVDDDEPITTLINPSRDVGNAAKKYGLSASDLQIAPTLNEAWAFIEAEIFEKGLISSRGDELVNILDTELKRNGLMTGIQMIAAPRQCTDTSVTCAADLIECTRKAVTRNGLGQPLWIYSPLDPPPPGYRLTREFQIIPYGTAAEVVGLLEKKIAGQRLSQRSEEIIQRFEHEYGVSVQRPEQIQDDDIHNTLVEGIRVCFTGTVNYRGKRWDRNAMEALAEEKGLQIAKNVTKTKCDVLIAADVATLSKKAQAATKFAKPVYSAEEFLKWAGK